MGTQLPKYTYYQDEDVHVEYQVLDNNLYLHCTTSNWKPSVLKRGYAIVRSIVDSASESGILGVYTISPNIKFCKLFGGVLNYEFEYNGKQYGVLSWELIR